LTSLQPGADPTSEHAARGVILGHRVRTVVFGVRRDLGTLVIFLAASMTSSCAIISIERPDGAVSVEYSFMTPVININLAEDGAIYKIQGLGIGNSFGTIFAGAYRGEFYVVDEYCRIVIWPQSNLELANLVH